jgi:hypothetical protein
MSEVDAINRQELPMLRWVGLGAVLWGLVGLVIALRGLGHVNADAKLLVGVASIVLPLWGGVKDDTAIWALPLVCCFFRSARPRTSHGPSTSSRSG